MAATAPRAGDGGGRVDTMVRLPTVTPQLAPPPYPLQRETPSTKQIEVGRALDRGSLPSFPVTLGLGLASSRLRLEVRI